MKPITLRNSRMELSLDSRGCMESLRSLPDGENLLAGPTQFWRVGNIDDTGVEPGVKHIDDARVRLTYPLASGDVVVKVYLDLSADRPEAICYADVENYGDQVIDDLEVHVTGMIDGRRVLLPGSGFAPKGSWHFPAAELSDGNERVLRYPVPASMQWEALYSDKATLYLACYDKTAMVGDFGARPNAGGAELFVRKYVEIGPRESFSLTFGIGAITGDWHGGADLYRRWAESWMQRPGFSEQVRRLWMLDFLPVRECNAEEWNQYKDVPDIYKRIKEKKHSDCVDIYGWSGLGHDTLYPEFVPQDWAGGSVDLQNAIEAIKDDGCLAMLYTNFRLTDTKSPTYQKHPEWATGQIERYNASLHVLQQVMCPSCRGWQDLFVERIIGLIKELKPDGIHADQVSAADPVLCRRDWHEHSKSSMAFPGGYAEILPRIVNEARKYVPHFFMFVEGVNDFYGQWFHFNQCAMSAEDLRFYRYTLPWQEHVAGIWNEKRTLRNMVVGLRGGHPDLAEPIKAARERLGEYLLYGTYRDNVGLHCDPDTALAASYVSRDGGSVLICAQMDENVRCRVDLQLVGIDAVQQVRVEVSDLAGRVVFSEERDGPEFEVELPFLEPGIVFARVVLV